MPRHDQRCLSCIWKAEIIVEAGVNPPCPECGGETERLWSTGTIQRDEIPGGILCENYGPTPVRFFSHSERRAYMKAHGLVERETFAPLPGTDKDPAGIPNPNGYIDEYTMRSKIELLLRAEGATGKRIQADMDQSTVVSGTVPDGSTVASLLESMK